VYNLWSNVSIDSCLSTTCLPNEASHVQYESRLKQITIPEIVIRS